MYYSREGVFVTSTFFQIKEILKFSLVPEELNPALAHGPILATALLEAEAEKKYYFPTTTVTNTIMTCTCTKGLYIFIVYKIMQHQ
jgi:hypothetical protein